MKESRASMQARWKFGNLQLYGEEEGKTWKVKSSGQRYGDYRLWIQLWANMTIILTSRLVATFHRRIKSRRRVKKKDAERVAQGKNFHCGGGGGGGG
jgi:hypothetical protein